MWSFLVGTNIAREWPCQVCLDLVVHRFVLELRAQDLVVEGHHQRLCVRIVPWSPEFVDRMESARMQDLVGGEGWWISYQHPVLKSPSDQPPWSRSSSRPRKHPIYHHLLLGKHPEPSESLLTFSPMSWFFPHSPSPWDCLWFPSLVPHECGPQCLDSISILPSQ